jgi:hypothetical protein
VIPDFKINTMGRRKKTLPANGIAIIRELASRGVKETDIAKALGISYNVWNRIKHTDERAKNAVEEARQVEHDELFGILYEKALKGDSVPAMFLLKTRHGYKEGAEATTNNAVAVQITLPGSMKPEDYLKAIEVKHPEKNESK